MYKIEEDEEALQVTEQVTRQVLHAIAPIEEEFADAFVRRYLRVGTTQSADTQQPVDIPIGSEMDPSALIGNTVVQVVADLISDLILYFGVKRLADIRNKTRKEISSRFEERQGQIEISVSSKGFTKKEFAKLYKQLSKHLLKEISGEVD